MAPPLAASERILVVLADKEVKHARLHGDEPNLLEAEERHGLLDRAHRPG